MEKEKRMSAEIVHRDRAKPAPDKEKGKDESQKKLESRWQRRAAFEVDRLRKFKFVSEGYIFCFF